MATIGLMSQHPGGFANHKHYYVQQQPHSPPQQHYAAAPPPPPQQSQPPHPHMQPQSHPHQPPPHYYHSAPASSFASSPSSSSYSHPNTSTAAFFLPPSKPYDGSAGPQTHQPQPPPQHYYSQQPMPPMPVQATATPAPSAAGHPSHQPQSSSSSPAPSPNVATSSTPAMPQMVQVNGSQYVLSPVQPASTSYPVMLIPVAANSHHDNSSNHNSHSAHSQPAHSSHSNSSSSSSGSNSGSMSDDERKARHIKTPQQMRVLKGSYTINPKPGKEEMKALMKETRCSYNEVCRWFRNERHKEKKIKDGRGAVDGKATSAIHDAAGPVTATNGGSAVDSKTADAMVESAPQSPSSSSVPSTPASSQPSSPLSTVVGLADGERRLSAWLHVFTAEFTSEQQQAALRELISRTRTLAESGNELECVLNGKRSRDTDHGAKAEESAAGETKAEEMMDAKRRKVEVAA